MATENIAWVLPRPSKSKYKGSFPLHFETKLFRMYDPKVILQPFGGMAEFGTRCDISIGVFPDVVCDSHSLPFDNNSIDFVLVDPPYSNEEAKEIYSTPKLKPMTYIREASRVCKPLGYVALYHKLMLPRPPQTVYDKRIFIGTRVWHLSRICTVFQKYPCTHGNVDEDCHECHAEFTCHLTSNALDQPTAEGKQAQLFNLETLSEVAQMSTAGK